MPNKHSVVWRHAFLAASALCLVNAPSLRAQTAQAPAAAAINEEDRDQPIVLSPFVVDASEEAGGYRATSTLAGTRIRTDLKDVGSAISVVTAQFLQDTGARNTEDLLVYTTNTEVGGTAGNFSGTGGRSDTGEARLRPHENTRVRGLARADNSRDFFITDIPWDSYNVGRVDLQRGPNSILFGLGSPAGMVNASLNTASFKDANSVEVRYGSFGSYRGSVDLNRVLLSDELALRVAGVNDKTYYRQDPAFSHNTRAYGALRFDPKLFRRGSARTSLRLNYEKGEIDANRPRFTTVRDLFTPWFTDPTLNKKLFDPRTIADTSEGALSATQDPNHVAGAASRYLADNTTPSPNYSPWLNNGAGGRVYDEQTVWFNDPRMSAQGGAFEPSQNGPLPGETFPAGVGYPWNVFMGISGYDTWARSNAIRENAATRVRGVDVGAVRTKTITDRNIYDSINQLIDGPNKRELTQFEAFNIALSQTFFDNRAGIDFTFDSQKYNDEANSVFGGDPALALDVMGFLPDGRPNINAGKAFVASDPYGGNGRWSDREALRITAFAELNFKDFMSESTLRQILGRHVFTGLYMQQDRDLETRSWYNFVHNEDYRSGQNRTLDSRRVNSLHYLSPNLKAVALQDTHIGRISASQIPTHATIYDFVPTLKAGATAPYTRESITGWQPFNLRVLNGYSGEDRNSLYTNATKVRDEVNSKAFVWQGFFFDGVLVPTVGVRKDIAENFNAGNTYKNDLDQSVYVNDPRWTLPTGASDSRLDKLGVGANNERYSRSEGDATSWSIVLHTPARIREKLPFGSNLSLHYNRSDNFEALTGRTDVFGATIPNPTGKTKDYGFVLSILDERLSLKVNWYETSVSNATIDSGTGSLNAVYRIGLNETWGRSFANWAKLGIEGFQNNYALQDPTSVESPTNTRIDPSIGVLRYQPSPTETVAQALNRQNSSINALLANPPPASLAQHWQLTLDQDWAGGWGTLKGGTQPSSLAVTGDSVSKGVEYELVATPTPNWNIAINASKTSAQRMNLAAGFAKWAEERAAFFRGPAGQVQLWGQTWGQQTVGGVWLSEFYSSYQLYKQLEGSDVPELRPWRFNLVTNYNFKNGLLKGVNVGGGYRWQDKSVIGFSVKEVTVNGVKEEQWDISKPYTGPTEDAVDLWVGYERRLTSKINWRIQLNARNVTGDNDYIPISTQPDGTMAVGRIPEPLTWTITNTFRF